MYETKNGYVVRETLSGLEVSELDDVVCVIDGKSLTHYEDENTGEIDDEMLEKDIEDEIETEDFINYQKEYC